MSNVRIRYDENDDGTVLTSRRMFVTGAGVEVKVTLDVANKKYSILDASSGAVVASGGDTVNLAVLKIQAKEGLTALGVSFSEEKRDRGQSEETSV
jgi:hypothetical protein